MSNALQASDPLASPRDVRVREALDLIDAVIYADLFDCAVTLNEIHRYARRRIEREALRALLDEDPLLRGVLCTRDGLYCLEGRGHLLELRADRLQRSRRLRRRARRVARLLQHAPFVRGLLLTGSVAADNADPDADVDLLVVVAGGRLSTLFAFLGPTSRLLTTRVFCPNYYLSTEHLAIGRRDDYIARELAQACVLVGEATALRAANGWVDGWLPNAGPVVDRVAPIPGGQLLQCLLEWPLRGRLGQALERRLKALALSRLRAHHAQYGASVPPRAVQDLERGVQLRFHALPATQSVLERYRHRRDHVCERLTLAAGR